MSDRPARRRGPGGLRAVVALALAWLAILGAVPAASAQSPGAVRWDPASARSLLGYIQAIGSHGLDPGDYAPTKLEAALASGDPALLERQASDSFGLVARDLATGHVRPSNRGRYFIASDPFDASEVADLIDRALTAHDVAATLESLAPKTRQYAALRTALANLGPGQERERRMLETNLDRWRWLPHDLGARYLMVNIPEFQLRYVENGRIVSSHRVIVGKRSTPTPRFSTQVTGVILNPTWTVPQSIVAESVGSLVRRQPSIARARGYTWSVDGGHLRVVQQPGPGNALGQMKLDMPNPFTVYIHDTPSKELFDREDRTLSHGCIRTQAPFDLALALLAGSEWTQEKIDETVATRVTTRIPLGQPVPAYIVYLTAVAQDDGTIRYLDDPYKLDGAIESQLAAAAGHRAPPAIRPAQETECSLG